MRATADHDLVVRLARQVGDHVVEETPLAWAWRRVPDQSPVDLQLLQAALNDAVILGFERTIIQDVPFGLRCLVDIGNKALSPAVNDPYTAIQAIQHLSVLVCLLAGRRLGDRLCHDEQGTLRVAVPLPQFADYLRLGTAQIRRSGAKEPAVARSLIQLFKDVGSSAVSEDRRRACARHIWLVLEDAKRETAQPADLETVQADGACRAGRAGSRPPPTSRRLSRKVAANTRMAGDLPTSAWLGMETLAILRACHPAAARAGRRRVERPAATAEPDDAVGPVGRELGK